MSPPIRDGSGSSIEAIRLGDGSEISEVRTGAGDVLFSAGPPDSGVARFTFDNADTSGSTAIDSFNDNDGSINGATTGVTGANEEYTTNEAYSFDGNNDFVEANSSVFDESFYNSSHSVAGWINPTSSGDLIFGIFDSSTNNRERVISTGNITINRFTTNQSGSTTIDDGNWHHVVYTYSGDGSGDMTGYVDGAQDVTATDTGSFSAGTQDSIYIGGNGLESQQFLSGDLDDIQVYDKELTSTEVNSLYNTGSIL